jgi:hypothetical protein
MSCPRQLVGEYSNSPTAEPMDYSSLRRACWVYTAVPFLKALLEYMLFGHGREHVTQDITGGFREAVEFIIMLLIPMLGRAISVPIPTGLGPTSSDATPNSLQPQGRTHNFGCHLLAGDYGYYTCSYAKHEM